MGTVTHPPFFDNRANIMKDDLVTTIEAGDRVSVAAEVFSMDAYQELKDQLDGLDEFRFIFTSQAFTKARMICTLTRTAASLLSTAESIETPCSV